MRCLTMQSRPHAFDGWVWASVRHPGLGVRLTSSSVQTEVSFAINHKYTSIDHKQNIQKFSSGDCKTRNKEMIVLTYVQLQSGKGHVVRLHRYFRYSNSVLMLICNCKQGHFVTLECSILDTQVYLIFLPHEV